MQVARWWEKQTDQKVHCFLCPQSCRIKKGELGVCNVRRNTDGELFSLSYAHPIALHADPIEKKPLYHFLPGTRSFSLGTMGCNLKCSFCQNWELARGTYEDFNARKVSPRQVVSLAQKSNCKSIAFTYNEPTVFGEYVVDIAQRAQQENLKTVMVTNGYINPQAAKDIYQYIDAANIDLKSFSKDFYKKECQGRLEAVLDAIQTIKKMNTFIELTTLIIPELNDTDQEIKKIVQWVDQHLGRETPLHFSAFYPAHKMQDRGRTPKEVLDRACEIAQQAGIHYVYEGNVMADRYNHTYCPECGRLLIERHGFSVARHKLSEGRCECGAEINIVQG